MKKGRFSEEQMVGILREADRSPVAQVAKAAGIPRRHISEMENSKRPIGKQNARKLAEVLKVDYRVFL